MNRSVQAADAALGRIYLDQERVTIFLHRMEKAGIIDSREQNWVEWKVVNASGPRPALRHTEALTLSKLQVRAVAEIVKKTLYDGEL